MLRRRLQRKLRRRWRRRADAYRGTKGGGWEGGGGGAATSEVAVPAMTPAVAARGRAAVGATMAETAAKSQSQLPHSLAPPTPIVVLRGEWRQRSTPLHLQHPLWY